MIELNKVYGQDCFEGIKLIDDKSIDLVLTDPPYNVKFRNKISINGRKSLYDDFSEMDWDKLDIKGLYDKIFPDLDRVVKSNGSVLMFCRIEWITYLVESANANNFDVKATIVWHKSNPIPQIRKRNYLSSTESIVWLARWDEKKCLFKFNFSTQNEMHNFYEGPICQGIERTEHPTQKPLKLIEWLLKNHSDVGDIVLDPFMGSGTTGVACKKHKRRFVGFELEGKYVDIANQRINATSAQSKVSEWWSI